jgi:hypothetical protein
MNSLPNLIELFSQYVGIEFESVEDGFRQFLDYLEKRKFVDLLGSAYFFDGPGIVETAQLFIREGRFEGWEQSIRCNCNGLMSALVAIFPRFLLELRERKLNTHLFSSAD